METQVLTLFRKLVSLGIFNMSWMPIESNHYLIGVFDNRIYVSVLDQDQTPRSTDNPSIAYYGVKTAYSTMMAKLSAPITNPDGQWKLEYSEHAKHFDLELEAILQAMIDVYPPEIGEISALGFSAMMYPNLQGLIGKLGDIAERLGNPLIKLRREGEEIDLGKLPSIKPQELANHFFARLAEIGVRPPFCVPYYYQVGGSSYTISMDPEVKAITICIEVSVGKFKTFAFVSPESFPHEAAVHPEFLEVLEGGYRSVVEFAGKVYTRNFWWMPLNTDVDVSEQQRLGAGSPLDRALSQQRVDPRVTTITDSINVDSDLSKWTPGPKGYIPRETFGSDTEAYITHLERVIELGRMTPAEFMEDAKRSAKELEQMYPHAAQILDLPGVDVDRQVDWTVVVTHPAFMPKMPSKFTISLPRDPLYDSFANSEFVHQWMDLVHTTHEQCRLAGGERLSSVESSIRFEVPGLPNPKLLVRPADGPDKFYLEEDQPKGARLADLTLNGDCITVDILNDEVFPIAGAEHVLTAMLKAVKEHMTK